MSLESYYFNINTRKFVRSAQSAQSISPPVWGHNDVRDFGVTFVQPVGLGGVQVLTTITSVQVNVSSPSAPNTVLASYTAGTASNNEHPFLLTLGSTLDAFMSGQTSPVEAIGQFRIVTATGENRYPFTLYIAPKQATATTADTSSEDGHLTKTETAALYMPKEVPAGGFQIWTTASGLKYKVYFHDDLTFHADRID